MTQILINNNKALPPVQRREERGQKNVITADDLTFNANGGHA